MIRNLLRGSLLVLGLVAAGGAAAGCDLNVGDGGFNVGLASGRASEPWAKTYTINADGRFELKNVNGSITVEPAAPGAPLEVKAERIARASTDDAAKELLKKVEIHEEVTADRVLIETRAPKTWGREGHEVKYTVKLPRGVRLDATNVNGGIDLRQLANPVHVTTTNGGIKGEALEGQVQASTTNGGIDVVLGSLPGPATFETVNGGVSLTVPAGTKADLAARVVNGGIHVDDALKLERQGEQSRRHLEGRLNGGGPRIEAATTNGGIHISAK